MASGRREQDVNLSHSFFSSKKCHPTISKIFITIEVKVFKFLLNAPKCLPVLFKKYQYVFTVNLFAIRLGNFYHVVHFNASRINILAYLHILMSVH